MAQYGPILLIEDDTNDADVIQTVIRELGISNGSIHFHSADEAYHYLQTTSDKPLLLLCDIRMPQRDGLTLLKQIQADEFIRLKSIPFIFLSAIANQDVIDEAYSLSIQGFYIKPASYVHLKDMIRSIITYWLIARHPSSAYSEKAKKGNQ